MFSYVSRHLPTETTTVETSVGDTARRELIAQDDITIVPTLRAGLPVQEAVSEFLPEADVGMVDAWREYDEEDDSFSVEVDMRKFPDMSGDTAYLVDPMIATGNTMRATYDTIENHSSPERYVIQAFVSAGEGLAAIDEHYPRGTTVVTAAIDGGLNDHGYIIGPGLGDAGDKAYGTPDR